MRGNVDDPPGDDAPKSPVPVGRESRARVPRQIWFETRLAGARSDVLVLSTLSGVMGDPIAAFRSIDRSRARHRILLPDRVRITNPSPYALELLAAAGADVRTVPAVPTDAMVLDGQVAVLPSERDEIAVFQIPAIVCAVTELFERIWRSAMPLEFADPPQTDVPERERELLTLLCLGCTDDLVATKLGVSVRTVRRMVATMMDRLGARSRFEAGFKAADSGWVKRVE